jgi:hypothetical protein
MRSSSRAKDVFEGSDWIVGDPDITRIFEFCPDDR